MTFNFQGEAVEMFQTHLTNLLANIAQGINEYCPDSAVDFFELACSQMELGDLKLKLASLLLTRELLETGCFPLKTSSQIYYFDNIFTLAKFLFSDESDEIEDKEILEQIANEIDLSLQVLIQKFKEDHHSSSTLNSFIDEALAFWMHITKQQIFLRYRTLPGKF